MPPELSHGQVLVHAGENHCGSILNTGICVYLLPCYFQAGMRTIPYGGWLSGECDRKLLAPSSARAACWRWSIQHTSRTRSNKGNYFSMSIGACEYSCGNTDGSSYRRPLVESTVKGTFGKVEFVPEQFKNKLFCLSRDLNKMTYILKGISYRDLFAVCVLETSIFRADIQGYFDDFYSRPWRDCRASFR